ncbi:MAG: FHA domain-containing protein [Desulfobacteraceae bacterium]|nr:FHA domain-containing protein [Desulfobacteraceae bacterium]
MDQTFSIEITKGPSLGQKFTFTKQVVNIGRSAVDNDLILNNQSISVHHARINFINGDFFLQDLGSSNGTSINGRLMVKNERVKMENRADVCVGSIRFQFRADSDLKRASQKDAFIDKTVLKKADKRQFLQKKIPSGPKKSIVSEFIKKPVVLVGICVLLLFLIIVKGNNSSSSKLVATSVDCSNDPVALPAVKSYGYMPKSGIDLRKDKIIFSFISSPGSVYLYYTPSLINSVSEVTVSLNGKQIGSVPMTGDAAGKETGIYLPRNILCAGENHIEFDNTLNPPGDSTWGIKNVYIKSKTELSCDVDEAKRLNDLGNSAYDEKSISIGNLFIASQYYSEALLCMDACTPLPTFYPEIGSRLLQVKTEIMDQFNNFMFLFKKARKLNNKESQMDQLEKILLLIPDKKDPRYIIAADELKKNEAPLNKK